MSTAFDITYQGRKKSLIEWSKGHNIRELAGIPSHERINFRDLINTIAGICLETWFAELAPEFPHFSVLVTSVNRTQAAQDALRGIAGTTRTKQATAVLDALELLDGGKLDPQKSRYAKYILEILSKKGRGQVVNRSEIIQDVLGIEYMASEIYRLEPEWVIVVIASLIYSGDLVMAIPGKKFESTNLSLLPATPVGDLTNFKHIEQPKDWNVPALKALFELMGIAPGLATKVTMGDDDAVQQLQQAITQSVAKLVISQQHLHNRFPIWGQSLLTEKEANVLLSSLEQTKTFLESLQAYSTPGKLKNFRYNVQDVTSHSKGINTLKEIELLKGMADDVEPISSYLSTAEAVMPDKHAWVSKVRKARIQFMAQITDPDKRKAKSFCQKMTQKLMELKKAYVKEYMSLHARSRLGINDDRKKTHLMHDERLETLQVLSTIDIMPSAHLIDFRDRLGDLTPCYKLTERELQNSPVCPYCSFKPDVKQIKVPAAMILNQMDDELDNLFSTWTQTLLTNLEAPTIKNDLKLLKPKDRKPLDTFIKTRTLPDDLGHDFINAVREVLSGLMKVEVKIDKLRSALLKGGAPATSEELKKRFEEYLAKVTSGKDPSKVRIILE